MPVSKGSFYRMVWRGYNEELGGFTFQALVSVVLIDEDIVCSSGRVSTSKRPRETPRADDVHALFWVSRGCW